MAAFSYITIRYSNSCDLGGFLFNSGEYYDLILDATLGNPTFEHVEVVNENEAKEIEFTHKSMKKTITMYVTASEKRLELLNFIRLCDFKIVTNKAGEAYNVVEMEVDGTVENTANLIRVKFVLYNVINSGCCLNNKLNAVS